MFADVVEAKRKTLAFVFLFARFTLSLYFQKWLFNKMDNPQLQQIKQRYGIVGNYEGLNRALEVALKIAPVDLSVLITGENGVGKEVFPRIIHDHSNRKNKKYFAVNCGAIPEGTIDSELFGHEKGAFTGAIGDREGYFAVANGGTLFLDEVGELPLSTQARLLRVLETGEYIRVGASEVRKTDVRIVAATNVNMQQAIMDGKFRQDLFYRLNSIPISIPPLRERKDDIILLFRKFAFEMSEKYKMPSIRLDENAQRMLMNYSWPGNIRQLKNLTENMSITSEERVITAEVLSNYLPQESSKQLVTVKDDGGCKSFENEREILYQILFDLRRDVTELKKIVNEQLGYKYQTSSRNTPQPMATTNALSVYQERPSALQTSDHLRMEPPIQEAEEVTEVRSLDELERETIQKTLERHQGKRKQAAAELGISERTLYRKIREYGLE